jgi:para-nitrobenzyl esterase
MALNRADTKYGTLRGVGKTGYSVFRGVPYAKPPLGALRWKQPEAPAAWEGVREARLFASRPVEEGSLPGSFYYKEFFADEDYLPPMSEDCLYLNVWTPAEEPGEKLPVAFWIHGGAFVNGFSSEMEFDGAAFSAQGLILVTAGHRLGALGYLVHPWFPAESSGAPGNYGLYDLIAALDWTRENIAAFGGDPERITVFGQSAGAMSAQALVSSKLTRGKIHRAIIQSGGGYQPPIGSAAPLDAAMERGKDFAGRCGAASPEELRSLPAEKILAAQIACFNESMTAGKGLPFTPVIDGTLLEDQGDRILEKGGHHDIPYMLGCTANDIGGSQGPAGEKPGLYRAAADFSSLNEKLGRRPCYVYYFTRCPLGDDAGAFHSAELWYIFGTLSRSWRPKTPEDYEISDLMVRYWCNFMKNGDPNGGGLAPWKPCSQQDPFVKVF